MKSNNDGTPRHVAFIMDGNGRWAKSRHLPRSMGHRAGVDAIERVVTAAFDLGSEYVTLYAFSTENRSRPKDEVDGLIDLIKKHLLRMLQPLIDRGVKVVFIGDLSYFADDVRDVLTQAEIRSAAGKSGTLLMALNYGGRDEIVRAARLAASEGEVTRSRFESKLYTVGVPDPDLIVRTGGEKRLSNFLTYQNIYSELYFSDTLWPDFDKAELETIYSDYMKRNRRFGKV